MTTPTLNYASKQRDPDLDRARRAARLSIVCSVLGLLAATQAEPLYVGPLDLIGLITGIYAVRKNRGKSVAGWIGSSVCGLLLLVEVFLCLATF
jgi:hypothetical protein